jgi:tol-pal system protein YbgF
MLRARLLIALLAGIAGQAALVPSYAAVPVVESTGTPANGSRSSYPPQTEQSQSEARSYGADQSQPAVAVAAAPTGAASDGGTAELFMRFQQLESDVAQLRGQVEEQSHRLEQLEKQQKEQYVDLDKRILALQQGQPAAAAASTSGGSAPTVVGDSTNPGTTATAPVTPSPSLDERDAYNAAFELTKGRRFQQAIDAFNELLVKYPNGQYASNAYYWLGECYLALPDPNLEKARQSFMQVVNLYPTNAKVPDSLYKLGIVYHRLGDRSQALGYLDRVQAQFPGTRAAQLAQAYAAELR